MGFGPLVWFLDWAAFDFGPSEEGPAFLQPPVLVFAVIGAVALGAWLTLTVQAPRARSSRPLGTGPDRPRLAPGPIEPANPVQDESTNTGWPLAPTSRENATELAPEGED